MRPHVKQSFRWAPHVSGLATVKPRDYQAAGEFEAVNEYALWASLRNTDDALEVGDLLEVQTTSGQPGGELQTGGELRICKFVGFESAKWAEIVPAEVAPVEESTARTLVTEAPVQSDPQGVHS